MASESTKIRFHFHCPCRMLVNRAIALLFYFLYGILSSHPVVFIVYWLAGWLVLAPNHSSAPMSTSQLQMSNSVWPLRSLLPSVSVVVWLWLRRLSTPPRAPRSVDAGYAAVVVVVVVVVIRSASGLLGASD